jgi:hypothetical protein
MLASVVTTLCLDAQECASFDGHHASFVEYEQFKLLPNKHLLINKQTFR